MWWAKTGYKIAYAGENLKATIDDFTTTNQTPGIH